MANQKLQLIATCVGGVVIELEKLETADKSISFATFSRHVDVKTLSEMLGYSFGRINRGLRLCDDYSVSFFKSMWKGKLCYHMKWSAIDHVFQ